MNLKIILKNPIQLNKQWKLIKHKIFIIFSKNNENIELVWLYVKTYKNIKNNNL